jgi:hypothetical protein
MSAVFELLLMLDTPVDCHKSVELLRGSLEQRPVLETTPARFGDRECLMVGTEGTLQGLRHALI